MVQVLRRVNLLTISNTLHGRQLFRTTIVQSLRKLFEIESKEVQLEHKGKIKKCGILIAEPSRCFALVHLFADFRLRDKAS